MTRVTPIPGAYLVTVIQSNRSIAVFTVGKDRSCTCGRNGHGNGSPCTHVRAVEAYLKAGGKRAPEAPPPGQEERLSARREAAAPDACPVCGAEVQRQKPYRNSYTGEAVPFWRCTQDPSHYWQWRWEQARAKRAEVDVARAARREAQRAKLTALYRASGASAARIAAFLDETPEERQAFLDGVRARLAEYRVYR